MHSMKSWAALAAGAAVITFGLAAAQARDARPVPPTVDPVEKAEAAQVTAKKIVAGEPCQRKVKVVYAGYGEGARAGCSAN